MFKQTKAYTSMRNKLVAALAMLLVASIMMVSSSYAWFTLSTAPEVTGIQTTVGSNGNLEIALSPTTGAAKDITSNIGDSFDTAATVAQSNNSWGNLVDLSDISYGLGNIVLNPSRLNPNAQNWAGDTAGILEYPKYGADGRITEMSDGTVTAIYKQTAADSPYAFITGATPEYGVRAVGSSSELTTAQLTFRGAQASFVTNIREARSSVTNGVAANGGALAELMIQYATEGTGSNFAKHVSSVRAMLDSMKAGVDNVEKAIMNAVLAQEASKSTDVEFNGSEITKDTYSSYIASGSNLQVLYQDYQTALATYTAANQAYASIPASGTVAWSDIRPVLEQLMNPEKVTVAGVGIDAGKQELINAVLANIQNVQVVAPTGSGLMAQMADILGTYNASVTIPTVSYNGITANNVKVVLKAEENGTAAPAKPSYKSAAADVAALEAPKGSSSVSTITDFYGYIIDLFVRTNATNSNLLLQKDAAQRIYENSTNTATQGQGSNMTFTFDSTLSAEQQQELVNAFRIVIFDRVNDGGKVLSYARLGTLDGNKAPLYLCDENGAEKKTADGQADEVICALEANTAQSVSVLVYIDGGAITNEHVSNAANALTGKLNLQFASSATLLPMDYTELQGADAGQAPSPEDPDAP